MLYVKSTQGKEFPLVPLDDNDFTKQYVDVVKEESLFLIFVTPELAKTLLDNQISNNRNINKARVKKYKEDIINNKWEIDAKNPIRLVRGVMYDGQHRCAAIIEAGVGAFIWMSLSDAVIPLNVDTGYNRSYSNIFQMRYKNSSAYGAYGVALANFRFAFISGNNKESIATIEEWIDKNTNDIELTLNITSRGSAHKNGVPLTCKNAPVQFAVFCALKAGVSPDILESFCRVANSGFMNSESDSSAIVLKNFKDSPEGKGSHNSDRKKLCAVAQEAICDFEKRKPRRLAYKGEKTYYSDIVKAKKLDL